ncbi:SMAD/FHA domain-containing protein [Hesseltinella vesiculosa]|uniref:SMAD/FHA domain-containing protein n=1 Tax=Hesseltinella vesiculosa TaxID=101127 RepID=A0A1X2GLD2_9FUNG|nr:SMAD/FHA domain-containing protein [Hesseltinella vesiculosa]
MMITAALTSTTARTFGPLSQPIDTTAATATSTLPLSHLRIVPHLDTNRSLVFNVIERDLSDGTIIKIGRFTDKIIIPTRITFKSKVVSRGHAEIWTKNGKFYIRDTKSSSGTFLNHMRLSPPNQESRPFLLSDGDIVQLGVDYQGGTEEIYRCVKMRVELNRPPQQRTAFSLNTFQSLRHLTTPPNNISVLDGGEKDKDEEFHVEECCICLYALAPCQSLFVAPCSHTFHYKCARPLLVNDPGFLCPLCRNYADLDASVAVEADEVLEMFKREKAQQLQQLAEENLDQDVKDTIPSFTLMPSDIPSASNSS